MNYEDIDDIFKCLQELENQGKFSEFKAPQIQTLKFVLRYMRMHVKWKTTYLWKPLGNDILTWVKDVERRVIQPTRNGSMTADILKKTLPDLLQYHDVITGSVCHQCVAYLRGSKALYRRGFAYEEVLSDELLMDWLEPLLENLKLLIHWNYPDLPKEQIKDVEEKLTFLRNILEVVGKELEEKNNITQRQGLLNMTSEYLSTQVKVLIENAIYLSFAAGRLSYDYEELVTRFSDLLVKINHIEPEIRMIYVQFLKASKTRSLGTVGIDLEALVSLDSLVDSLEPLLKDLDDGSIIPIDDHQLAFLRQELSFLRNFLLGPHLKQDSEPELESFHSLLMQVEAMAREGASLARSLCDGQKKDDSAKEMYLLHSNSQEIVDLLKPKIGEMYLRVPKPSTSNFPRTPKFGFLDFFMQNLEELLDHRADSIAYVKNEIETVQSELALLRSFIRNTINNPEKDENIARRILDVAYEAERVIDLISGSHFPRWYYMLWLSDVIVKIKILRKESTELCSKKKYDVSMLNMEKASIHDRPPVYTLAPEEEVVGFDDQAEKIIHQLIGGPEELDIVSIVGMPGLGKTTLAKTVYEHPSVTRHFHVRSWYCISQVYNRQELLLSILDNVTELTKGIQNMDDGDLQHALCKSLKGRRYLIVLDDIWSIEPWDDMHKSFPDDCNGSRILFTSRIQEVALRANPRSSPHDLRMFTDAESWELLQKKVFQRGNCPPELHAIGKQIAENCRGLPLSVVVIAGILRKTMETEAHWRQISESLSKQAVGDSSKCRDVLELSYRHLPDHLKPCFLYLGAFPEDKEIPAWKLLRLWIAEGLVQKTESESLEQVAEDYLKDLIARRLVLVAKNKCNGGVKSCHLHDLLHEFSREKATDEKFFLISNELVNPEQYRHSICGEEIYLDKWMPDDPYVRSLLCFSVYIRGCRDLSVLPNILKLLRVLDLDRVCLLNGIPAGIGLLVHLRYLAIRGEIDRVPSSVGNLWRLETFLLHGTNGEVIIPEIIFKMAHLKHAYINKRAAIVSSDTFQPEESFVSSIQKLSNPVFRHGDSTTEKLIRSLTNLQKLKCIFFGSRDSHSKRFPMLNLLSKLESLNVTYNGMGKPPSEFSFPSTLKKLTLTEFFLPWSEISKFGIGRLPQLEVLKLFRAFEGQTWNVSDDEFRNLKVLKLESLSIVEWNASPDAFPCLKQLVLRKCRNLEEVPSIFRESSTLEMIEVRRCSSFVDEAVREIEEELRGLGNDELKVLIQPAVWY